MQTAGQLSVNPVKRTDYVDWIPETAQVILNFEMRLIALKTETCQYANFVFTSGNGDCRQDNFRCHQPAKTKSAL